MELTIPPDGPMTTSELEMLNEILVSPRLSSLNGQDNVQSTYVSQTDMPIQNISENVTLVHPRSTRHGFELPPLSDLVGGVEVENSCDISQNVIISESGFENQNTILNNDQLSQDHRKIEHRNQVDISSVPQSRNSSFQHHNSSYSSLNNINRKVVLSTSKVETEIIERFKREQHVILSRERGAKSTTHKPPRTCKHQNCTKTIQKYGLCHKHGGVRYCQVVGCLRKDRGEGYCVGHGGGKRCCVEGCDKVVRKGNYCTYHTVKPTGKSNIVAHNIIRIKEEVSRDVESTSDSNFGKRSKD